jgi:hypothetical protein
MAMGAKIVFLSLLVGAAVAAPPSIDIAGSGLSFNEIDVHGETYLVATMGVAFDQDIYVENNSGEKKLFNNVKGGNPGDIIRSTIQRAAFGTVKMACGGSGSIEAFGFKMKDNKLNTWHNGQGFGGGGDGGQGQGGDHGQGGNPGGNPGGSPGGSGSEGGSPGGSGSEGGSGCTLQGSPCADGNNPTEAAGIYTCADGTDVSNLQIEIANCASHFRRLAVSDGLQGVQGSIGADGQDNAHGGPSFGRRLEGGGGGPPFGYIFVLPSTPDPVRTFISKMMKGFLLPEEVNQKKVTVALLMGGGPIDQDFDKMKTDLEECAPTLTFPGEAPAKKTVRKFMNQAGEEVTGSITFQERLPESCNYDNFKQLQSDMDLFVATVENECKSTEDAMGLGYVVDTYATSNTYRYCKDVVQSFVVMGEKEVTLEGDTECRFDYSEAGWKTDPCCNPALHLEQCCLPQEVKTKIQTATNMNQDILEMVCLEKYQGQVASKLSDLIELGAQKVDSRIKPEKLFQKFNKFINTCFKDVFDKKCKSGKDCYSGLCNKQAKKCMTPPDKEGDALLKCFVQNMDDELRQFLRLEWGLKASEQCDSPADGYCWTNFTKLFKDNTQSEDCTGPKAEYFDYSAMGFRRRLEEKKKKKKDDGFGNAEEGAAADADDLELEMAPDMDFQMDGYVSHKSSVMMEIDDEGNWQMVRQEGNKTGCLGEKGCNYNQWMKDTKAKCESGSSHFCGLCQGGADCFDISSQPSCKVNGAYDQTTCASLGGAWTEFDWSQMTDYHAAGCHKDFSGGAAWDGSRNGCLGSDSAWYSSEELWGEWDFSAAWSVCIDTVLNEGGCTGGSFWWYDELKAGAGACIEWSKHSAADCTGGNLKWLQGYEIKKGVYNTANTCTSMCSDWELAMQGVTGTECTSKKACTMPCKKCVSHNEDAKKSMCVVPATTANYANKDECERKSGVWANNYVNDNGDTITLPTGKQCVLKGNKTKCAAITGSEFHTCKSQGPSEGQCGKDKDDYQKYMGCTWETWAECTTKQECESSGECDDWEFEVWKNDGTTQGGACVVKPTIDEFGFSGCTDQWSRIGCIDSSVTKASDCTGTGKTWHAKGVDETTCQAHGKMCFEDGMWEPTPKSADMCKQCGGDMDYLYTWTGGDWGGNDLIPLTWKQRTWGAVNEWRDTFDMFKVDKLMNMLIGNKLGNMFANNFRKAFLKEADVIAAIACACNPEVVNDPAKAAVADCSEEFGKETVISTGKAFAQPDAKPDGKKHKKKKKKDTAVGAPGVKVTFNSSAVKPEDDFSSFNVTQQQPGALMAKDNQKVATLEARRRMLKGGKRFKYTRGLTTMGDKNAHKFASVRNANDIIVGQIVGSGVGFASSTVLQSATSICVKPSTTIYEDSATYPIKDFALSTIAGVGVPLEETVTLNNKGEWCMSTKNPGTYIPVLRVAAWTSATKNVCPPTATGDLKTTCDASAAPKTYANGCSGEACKTKISYGMKLNGLTKAAFNEAAQVKFRKVIGSKIEVPYTNVVITSISDARRRRLVAVPQGGRVLAASGINVNVDLLVKEMPASSIDTLKATLKVFVEDAGTTGFKSVMNAVGVPVASIEVTKDPTSAPFNFKVAAAIGATVIIVIVLGVFLSGAIAAWTFRRHITKMMSSKVFAVADKNADGVLDAAEIQALIKKELNKDLTLDQVKGMMKKYDEDGDATTLTYQEYKDMLTKWLADGKKAVDGELANM